MSTINQNDDTKCEVCFENPSVHIPLFICAHSNTFCEKCIKEWLIKGHRTCPKCRKILPVHPYLENTNQNRVDIANASLTLEYRLPSVTENIRSPPSSTATRLLHNVLMCYSIGLLVGLIIYPVIKQL